MLARALTGPLIPIEWKADDAEPVSVADDDDEDDSDGVWRRAPDPGAGRPQPTPPAAPRRG